MIISVFSRILDKENLIWIQEVIIDMSLMSSDRGKILKTR